MTGAAVVALCYGGGVSAVDVDVTVGLRTEFTDNGERAARDGTSERQDNYDIAVEFEHLQGDVEYSVDYTASEARFSEDTQEDRSSLDGEAFVRYFSADNPFHVSVSHSRRRVLNRRQDRNLLANLDERSILTAVPGLQFRVSPVDTLRLDATVSDISYRFNEERDSEQTGVMLDWQHRLSSLDQFSLSLRSSDTEFKEVDGFDYEYDSAVFTYSAQLRRLSYSIGVGYIQSSADQGDDVDGPIYTLDLTYETGVHRINLRGERRITDTSIGNADQNLVDGLTGGDGTADSFDRYELSSLEVEWSTPIVCERCDLRASLRYNDEAYAEDSLQDNSETFGSIGLGYRISRFARMNFSVSRSDQQFDNPLLAQDQERDRYELRFGYDFSAETSAQVFFRYEELSSRDPESEYEESIVGLAFEQRF
ncbi:hypothetical protein FKG94_19195 [Exilibacterium tricleocarpae]|uniref:Outer membrane beta-barrel protein n=1 Tax=Exilibacterium tricleocarpae TaxID=2591008 RepID=A0A545T3K9_9GAMM|nr:hypothetical protein [Exilibacterium tricleocarpae]TQV71775.1 hypothetical protein FKG94_19195 [Exilibacterium tricleocarpae]